MALDCELWHPPSLLRLLPLMHRAIEGVGKDLRVIFQELSSKVCVLVPLHGAQRRLY
jgi:hypothetical protein